ncbi:hypothetical protein BD779DRAFT_763646 [Infundibulicybe gibba]|nr:hypothetical protein BD779DRAFT_763646 [Infundibulicybe gibba]
MSGRLVVNRGHVSAPDDIFTTCLSSGRKQIPRLFLDLADDAWLPPHDDRERRDFVHPIAPRPTLHPLPLLSIPSSTRGQTTSSSDSPETPASLSSPIVGVVDLTRAIRTISSSSVAAGGFSDIYEGEWERHNEGPDDLFGKTQTVQVRFFNSSPALVLK